MTPSVLACLTRWLTSPPLQWIATLYRKGAPILNLPLILAVRLCVGRKAKGFMSGYEPFLRWSWRGCRGLVFVERRILLTDYDANAMEKDFQ